MAGQPPPLLVLYILRQGAPHEHKLIHVIFSLAVCGAPATIILDNIVGEFRRSPAAVVHQDRHHAVVLTELIPDALLDWSPGNVIELNVC